MQHYAGDSWVADATSGAFFGHKFGEAQHVVHKKDYVNLIKQHRSVPINLLEWLLVTYQHYVC